MLDMVHAKTVVPVVNAVRVLVASVVVVILPGPDTMVHKPVPLVGVLPVKVVLGVLTHNDWLPAVVAVVGGLFTTITMVEVLEQTPLVVFH